MENDNQVPVAPNLLGLTEAAASKALAEHEAAKVKYFDVLMAKSASNWSADDRAWIGKEIAAWNKNGRQ